MSSPPIDPPALHDDAELTDVRPVAANASSSAWEQFRARKFFASLDGIRCLAISAVIWHHAHGELHQETGLGERGFLGVDLFFVMSGFLIVTLLLRERDKSGDIAFGKFYMRRTLRIFPLYYAVVLTLTALFLLFPGSNMEAAFFEELPYLLTYTSNWYYTGSLMAIAWSLSTEEQFYLVWPPLEKYARGAIPYILLAGLALCEAVSFGVLDGLISRTLGPEVLEMEIFHSTFAPILLGVALAHILHERKSFDHIRRILGFPGAPWIFTGLILFSASGTGDVTGMPRLLLHLAMTGLVGSVVVKEQHAMRALLTFPPLARIGVVSYGMYLLHIVGLHAVSMVEDRVGRFDLTVRFAAGFLLTWGVAELSFRYFEGPILRFKKRFEAAR